MKKIFMISTLFITTISFGQTNINDLHRKWSGQNWYKKGEKKAYNGDFVEYYDNGKIKGKGTMVDGLLDGQRIRFYENGDTLFVREYGHGDANGYTRSFYPNKNKKEEGSFLNGNENGKWIFYYESGQLQAIVNYNNKIYDGDYCEFDETGKLIKKLVYKNGQPGYGKTVDNLVDKALAYEKTSFGSENAIQLYDQAINENATIPELYFNRGVSKQNKFDFEGAIKDYDKAIELKSDYMEAYANRGNSKINLFTTKGNLKPALEQTKNACEDLKMAQKLGDKTIGTSDLIFIYCGGLKK